MAKKTKAATKRTKVKDLPKSKREMTGKDLKKIKGGLPKPLPKPSPLSSTRNIVDVIF